MHDVNDYSGSGPRRTRVWGVYVRRPLGLTGRMIFGLIVLSLGVIWTLGNLGLVDSDAILRWWPFLLILFGIAKMIGLGTTRQPVAGMVFSVVGLLLLGNELSLIHVHLWQLWPVLMILLGTALVVRSIRGPRPVTEPSQLNAEVHSFTMMGGLGVKNVSQDFRGGDVSAVMGGVEVDLRGTRSTSPQVVIDAFAWWGGIEIFVPRDWRVVSEVLPLMAGYEDHTGKPEGEAKTTLVIRGLVVMGGIEIKN
jgi:predicted membrane protein